MAMPLSKKLSVRPKHPPNPATLQDYTMGQTVNIADFDPVHRKRDFKYIKANVLGELDLKKTYTL